MDFDFETHILSRLVHAKNDLDLDVEIEVSEEQNFAKMDKLEPNTIYVVIKYLASDIEYYVETTPVQLLVLSEQDSLDSAKLLLNKFAQDNNWQVVLSNNTYVKQQYNSPVVLNNYVEIAYGYRSVLYLTGTLYIMNSILDIKEVTTDNVVYKPLAFNLAYVMSTNTQQLPSEYIASSLKTVSTISITMTIPMKEDFALTTKVMQILAEKTDGNDDFDISFDVGLTTTNQNNQTVSDPLSLTMRLISAQITTAPNQVPSLQLGFMK